VWFAPGRVNLIGEHTDYKEGFVLPYAIGAGVAVAVGKQPQARLDVWSAHGGTAGSSSATRRTTAPARCCA
jgi:galactokinase